MATSVPTKGIAEPSYAVHRESEVGPSSSYHGDNRPNTPPPYSGPTHPSLASPPPSSQSAIYPGLPKLDYSLYHPPSFTLSKDQTAITSTEPRYSTYPAALVSLIQSVATVPPKPIIRIVGKGSDGPEFDVRINMMNLIIPEGPQARMNYVKIIGKGEKGWRGEAKETVVPDLSGGLEGWARRFCEDGSAIKYFTLERTVQNWDTSALEGRLLSLISSLSYRGHVTISFSLHHSKVIVRSPDKLNRFFSNVTSLFTGVKKYEIVKAVWPYANGPPGDEGRRCTVQSEEVWWGEWKDAIKHAIVARRKGWVTVEDRLKFLMEPKVEEETM